MKKRDRKMVRNLPVSIRETPAPEPGETGMRRVQELIASATPAAKPVTEVKESEPEHVRG